jgi:hypothetical protein
MYRHLVARPARTIQMALKELDSPCALDDLESWFARRARIVLPALPEACIASVLRVVTAVARKHEDGTLPVGQGVACLRHFVRRSEQLATIHSVSDERRFALIELTSLASLAGGWAEGPWPRRTVATYKECLHHVTQLSEPTSVERERWRIVVNFLLGDESSGPIVMRNVSYALVWCGCFSADKTMTDEQLALQYFDTDRETFVRGRLEALRWLPKLFEFSLQSSRGGVS